MVPKICSVDGCQEPSRSRGWCKVHYMRWWKTGDPGTEPRKRHKYSRHSVPHEDFWRYVEKTPTCWIWNGTTSRGYGKFTEDGEQKFTHRISWEKVNGPIPKGLIVDHICHNPPCLNPEHLRLVTYGQNSQNRKGAQKDSKSGIRGVYWHSGKKKWRTQVRFAGKKYSAGHFDDPLEAEKAVIALRNELFTHNTVDKLSA